MNFITLPLGFRFVKGDNVYEVIKDDNSSCEDCAFLDDRRCRLLDPYNLACSAATRSDNMSVCFKKIGYVFTPTNPDAL